MAKSKLIVIHNNWNQTHGFARERANGRRLPINASPWPGAGKRKKKGGGK